jgi:hypothetical protein
MNGDKETVARGSPSTGMFSYNTLLKFKIFCAGTEKQMEGKSV